VRDENPAFMIFQPYSESDKRFSSILLSWNKSIQKFKTGIIR